jgi:hypothetical protein
MTRAVMTTPRLFTVRLPVTLALVAAVVTAGQVLIPRGDAQHQFQAAAQVLAGVAAAWVCFHAARGRTGPARRWRNLLGLGLAGWSALRLWWLVQAVADPARDPGVVRAADIGFLILPVFLLLALLAGASALPRPVRISGRRDLIVLTIDSVLISGSMLALLWSALPAEEFAGREPALIAVAAAYPLIDLMLAVMTALLIITRPSSPGGRAPLRLVGLALLAFGAADTVRLFQPAGDLSAVQSAGYLLGPALIALAATSRPPPPDETTLIRAEADWVHLLLPYVPVVACRGCITRRTTIRSPAWPTARCSASDSTGRSAGTAATAARWRCSSPTSTTSS